MRNRVFAVVVIAIIAGGGLAFATYSFVNNKPGKVVRPDMEPVVVAAADLQLGAELRKEDLTIVQFPKGNKPDGAFSKPDDVVGRGLIVPIVRNEIILSAKLASKEAGAGLPPVIPEGMRAVSVRVNEVVGVAGYVLPGTRVDVIATANPGVGSDAMSKVVLANVLVLTAGTRLEPDQEKGKPIPVSVVTLLVSPEQAERLALASTEGKIQLALRNPLDQSAPATPGIRPAVLMGAVAVATPRPAPRRSRPAAEAPAPVMQVLPAPPPAPTVEIIRGDKRATEIIK